MKYLEILRRITGISTPLGGISWEPPASEREVAQRVMTFLEDRRLLYRVGAEGEENPDWSVASAFKIRERLENEVEAIDRERELHREVRAIMQACREFQDLIDKKTAKNLSEQNRESSSYLDAVVTYNVSLAQLRRKAGIHIANIAIKYKLDVDDQLASILPTKPD